MDPWCCDDEGGIRSPIDAPACMGDVDNDGVNDACEIGWQPGDPHKMHYPQLPDEDGWDVNATQPLVLADDFRCTQTGFIKDIHFWGSWKDGIEGEIDYFVLSIHEDIPADQNPDGYSKPGTTLWERDISNFGATPKDPPTMEGWYDPFIPETLWNNHQAYFQYDVYLDTADWFFQEQGTIYWLNISAVLVPGPTTAVWGWKSTENHWNDDAVWAQWGLLNWVDMWEPAASITDVFEVIVDPAGGVVGGGGSGYGGGEWYYYPDTNWWNQWFYDHPVDPTRRKLIHIEFDAMAFGMPMGVMTVAANWSTPDYSNPDQPPLPPLDQFIVREELIVNELVHETMMHYIFDVVVPDYNPEWVSIDIRGNGFAIFGGTIVHTCQGSLDLAFVITNGGEDPTGACCYDPTGGGIDSACIVTTLTDCINTLNGTFEGAGTTCEGMVACCLPTAAPGGECVDADALCCRNELGGISQGPGTMCTATEACCLNDNTCIEVDPLCCDELGGTAQGTGSVCGGMEACCLDNGTCLYADALCCVNELGGTPMGPGTFCTAPEACCFTDGSCSDLDPLCCTDQGGDSRGPGSVCLGDVNGNTINDACELIKWDQSPPDLTLAGLHAHEDAGSRIIIADQWICEGGDVTDFHWWGSYENVGWGLAGFHLSIHANNPAVPWCLPGIQLWAMDVPMAQILEVPTGLINSFGEPVFMYHYFLPEPFAQTEGEIYWLDISAISNNPGNPALWKWSEFQRANPPIICPAAYTINEGASWTSIEWPGPRYSDMAFQITSEEGTPPVFPVLPMYFATGCTGHGDCTTSPGAAGSACIPVAGEGYCYNPMNTY
ncbi:MAG: hypothetical protein KJ749_03190, partial [Planctomycetes bacterium]|nr:hypothetical protein [Planctomycetota bacterium]